ncbi:GDSL esterase/lipase, partial [Cucurbita argyrosperma subsp. sororia]
MKFFQFKSFFVVYVLLNLQTQYLVLGEPQVPCFFIFGDSLSDNGNNNNLVTLAKANYKPYGIDFPQGPTGRFSNGRNLADFIAENLGFASFIPPFARTKNTQGSESLQGVNYASGGAGIRRETGQAMGRVISLDEQLRNHEYTISKIDRLLGRNESATRTYLERCLYVVEMGSNDYLNNYFSSLPYTTSLQFSPREYALALLKQLSSQVKTLYTRGAKKVAVFGVGSLGCTPYATATYDTQGSPCVDRINDAIQLFNVGLRSLVQDLNANFTDAKYTFIDTYQISSQGPPVSFTPCCQVKLTGAQCDPYGKVCGNRSEAVFWDGVHPTEIAFMALANRSFNAQFPNDTHPFDISQLAQLKLP